MRAHIYYKPPMRTRPNSKAIRPGVGGSLPPGRGAVGSGGRLGGGHLRQARASVDFAATPSWPPPSPTLPLPRGRDPRPASILFLFLCLLLAAGCRGERGGAGAPARHGLSGAARGWNVLLLS